MILVLCVVCSISAMAILTQDVNYLYTDFAEHKEILSEYNTGLSQKDLFLSMRNIRIFIDAQMEAIVTLQMLQKLWI